jgi:hypothetical protein
MVPARRDREKTMQGDAPLSAPTLHLAFIAGCLLLLVLVYTVPIFDLRSLRRMAARRLAKAGADAEKDRARERPVADLLDRPDLGAILNLLVIVGTGLAMLVGWRVPAEIERIYGGGASFGLLFPQVEMTTLGKGAQVIGAVCLGLVALRLLRLLVYFAAAALVGLGCVLAIDYVFEVNLFDLL